MGAQQMADLLTTKNLSLEEQVRELQEAVENLVSSLAKNRLCSHPLHVPGIHLRYGQR
jgi:tetrahydromethanopterin S-methyltransferase subunit B